MTVKQLIDMACAYSGITKADLARNAGWSPQTLSNRLNTGKFSMEDWEKIGRAMGATVKIVIEFPDGKELNKAPALTVAVRAGGLVIGAAKRHVQIYLQVLAE